MHSALYTHQIEMDIRVICSHITKLSLNDVVKLITLMIITLVK